MLLFTVVWLIETQPMAHATFFDMTWYIYCWSALVLVHPEDTVMQMYPSIIHGCIPNKTMDDSIGMSQSINRMVEISDVQGRGVYNMWTGVTLLWRNRSNCTPGSPDKVTQKSMIIILSFYYEYQIDKYVSPE